jgi:hypothetical protein
MAERKALHKHAFWLYGVVVGLAIKEALESTIPHLIDPSHIPPSPEYLQQNVPHSFYPEFLRLVVFLALVIRFYLGSAYFFTDAYEAEDADTQFEKKNYAVDFVCGFLHFVGFVILALTIDIHSKPIMWFPIAVSFILLYDVFWYLFCFRYETSELMFMWMVINAGNFVLSGFLYLLVDRFGAGPVSAEVWALWPVLLVSLFDIGGMMQDKPYFDRIRRVFSDRRQPQPPADSRA